MLTPALAAERQVRGVGEGAGVISVLEAGVGGEAVAGPLGLRGIVELDHRGSCKNVVWGRGMARAGQRRKTRKIAAE